MFVVFGRLKIKQNWKFLFNTKTAHLGNKTVTNGFVLNHSFKVKITTIEIVV